MKLKCFSDFLQLQIKEIQQGGIKIVVRKFITLLISFTGKFSLYLLTISSKIKFNFYKKIIFHYPNTQWTYAGILPQIKFQLDTGSHHSKSHSARQFLKYLYPYLKLYPECILKWRLTAYYSCWLIQDHNALQEMMQTYIDTQKFLAKQHEIECLHIRLANDIFFANYSVHAFLDTHIKAMLLDWTPKARIIVLIDSEQMRNVSNPTMLKYWRKYVDVVTDKEGQRLLSGFLPYFLDDLTWMANLNGQATYIESAKCIVQRQWEKEKRKPLFELDNDDITYGREMMQNLGLPKDAWFVTLHVRDAGCKTGSYLNNGEIDGFRNADIDTYYGAVNAIIQRGGYVVRVGDPNMKPIKPMKGLIDYAHSQIRSNRLDIFLFTQCRFFIGTSSGPIMTPFLFGVPVVGTNYAPLIGRLQSEHSLIIPKLIWDTKNHRYLSFYEILSSEIGRAFNIHTYQENDLCFVDNTPEDLADVAIEMMDILNGKMQYSSEDNLLQERINQLYREYSSYGDMGRFGRNYLIKIANLGLL